MAYLEGNWNPLCTSTYFHEYESRRRREGAKQTWPLYLDQAFLDAILLVPQMGKRKYISNGALYGRNMLISDYLWAWHWTLYPPGPGENIPVGKDREKQPGYPAHPNYRTRKQISSHIQVLKDSFKTLPFLHFVFPVKHDEEDENESPDRQANPNQFQNNPVLAALAEGRLPVETPNYAYFANLVAAGDEVFLRPITCHVYTSHCGLTLSEDGRKAFTADGTCLHADAYTPDGIRLEAQGDFPHLRKNSAHGVRRDGHSGDQDEHRTYLLHEYTESLVQTESNSVLGILSKWDRRFPTLRAKLTSALNDTHPSYMNPARTGQFPVGDPFRWPRELYLGTSEPLLWDYKAMCRPSRRGNTIEVDFPAASWANTFYRLAKYVTAEREGKEKERTETAHESTAESECGYQGAKLPTPSDLLQQIAMYQEIWSAPNEGARKPIWERRCIPLWTFSPACGKTEEGRGKQPKKPSRESAGTTWRFLSKLGPMSQYHQQQVYLPGRPKTSERSRIIPNLASQQHPAAVVCENSGGFYDVASLAPAYQLQERNTHLIHWNRLGAVSCDLVMPLPTAYLHSSYASDGPTGSTAAETIEALPCGFSMPVNASLDTAQASNGSSTYS
ncbi:conidiophore development regulator abaA [Apiospora arundinis]